jgi:hypothetical protein
VRRIGVSHPLDALVPLAALALVLVVLYKNLWRAVLCLAPASLSLDLEDPPDRMRIPHELTPLVQELTRLGFCPIGSRREKPRLAAPTIFYDFAKAAERVFATICLSSSGTPHLYYLTRTRSNGFVITANYRRPAREIPGFYLAGALENVPAERIYRAHMRRIEPMGPVGEYTQEGRLAAAKAWSSGPGRSEIRQQNLHGLVWTAGILGILAAAIFGRR